MHILHGNLVVIKADKKLKICLLLHRFVSILTKQITSSFHLRGSFDFSTMALMYSRNI